MTCVQELKFGIGDGKLNYYLYNWRVQREMTPQQVGLVLL
jgi:glycylpeptide N-tetradecanoyltransferase